MIDAPPAAGSAGVPRAAAVSDETQRSASRTDATASRRRRAPRVLVGLSDICGYYSQLERGLREIGVDATLLNAFPSGTYPRTTKPGALGSLVEWLGRRRVNAPRGSVRRYAWMGAQGVALCAYMLATLPKYDAYVFASGESFLRGRDRWFLRLFGKRIIAVCHGSDTRPPYLNGGFAETSGPVDAPALARAARATKNFVRNMDRGADVIVNHPFSGQFHERPFVQWLTVGIPCAMMASALPAAPRGGRLVVVHAPTRPGPKGTAEIERAVASLQAKGYDLELRKIVGRPNAEVLAALAECDFVVDELYSDTTMASFATEAAFFGKPAIVGMHGYDLLRRITEEGAVPPALVCQAADVEQAIETLARDEERRTALGSAARAFVMTRWSAAEVASRFHRIIEDDIPREWWFQPDRHEYVHGWGLTDARLREVLAALIDAEGASALQLDDKPYLRQRMIDLASGRA